MIVFGYRRYVERLAVLTFLCGSCGNATAHTLLRTLTKFTLFFIPLFPLSSKYSTQCTFCGHTQRLRKDEADSLRAKAEQVYPAAPNLGNPLPPASPHRPSGHQR